MNHKEFLLLQAKNMKEQEEKRYNTFSFESIWKRVQENLIDEGNEVDVWARNFQLELNKQEPTLELLRKQELKTILFYLELKNPKKDIRSFEKIELFNLIQKYEIFFNDFKNEKERLISLKEYVRPDGLTL